MAQVSDVTIANQGFSSFRTELNNILTALNTSHIEVQHPVAWQLALYGLIMEQVEF